MGDMKLIPMKVWRPDGTIRCVTTITSDEDHFGNRVAEGDLREADYYPALVRSARLGKARERKNYLALRDYLDRKDYARGWVDRWLECAGTQEGR